jgi:uncharacterized protein with GYD domain
MPKLLTLVRYTTDGAKGLLKDKASGREAAIKKMAESAGGKVESIHWIAAGEYHVAVVWEFPDIASYVSLGTAAQASGFVAEAKTLTTLTSKEMDQALGKSVTYRPPGTK